MGMFYDFIPNESVRLVGAEAAGKGVDTALHAATIAKGKLGIFHGMEYLSKKEGVIPAIESAHAVAAAMKIAPTMRKDQIMIICLSGRGDKDMQQIAQYRGVKIDD